MSQEKAQLIAPLGNMTVPGVTATGVITATTFKGNIAGSASSIVQGSSITAGVVTATSFAGNLTGNIQRLADSGPNISVGVVTATSFSGNLTGSVTDLTSAPNITVGVVTATTLKGPVTGNITGNVSGHAGGLGVSYNGGWPGAGTSQISAGVMTATTWYGDGSNLDGVSSGPVSQQAVTANSGTTDIDLSSGNLIYMTQSADTTVSFANTENGIYYIIRTKDDTTTDRTITWPTGIGWSGGTAPTLLTNSRAAEAQVFELVTRDEGVSWQAKEVVRYNPTTKNLFAMGLNASGQLGFNNEVALSSPTQLGTAVDWYDIGNGRAGTNMEWQMATKTDGTLWVWGDNDQGQLGLNQSNNLKISSPTQIPGTNWTNIGKGGRLSAAVKTDGSLWTWGSANYGQLGLNQGYPDTTTVGVSSPTQVGNSLNWSTDPKHLHPVGTGCYAIKQDGTMWTWGGSYGWGVLGKDTPNQSSPIQLPGTNWSSITAGWAQGYAVKLDGTLWGWGESQYNEQLPQPMGSPTKSPTQVTGGPGNWSQVNQGVTARETGGGAAIGADGTMWCWGVNAYGEIGNNGTTPTGNALVQVPGTTWRTVQGGYSMTAATKTDGTLWVWGRNQCGKLGKNNITSYSSPVQVPGTYSPLIGYCGAGNPGNAIFPLKIAEP